MTEDQFIEKVKPMNVIQLMSYLFGERMGLTLFTSGRWRMDLTVVHDDINGRLCINTANEEAFQQTDVYLQRHDNSTRPIYRKSFMKSTVR